jgi:hypothetical protein
MPWRIGAACAKKGRHSTSEVAPTSCRSGVPQESLQLIDARSGKAGTLPLLASCNATMVPNWQTAVLPAESVRQ